MRLHEENFSWIIEGWLSQKVSASTRSSNDPVYGCCSCQALNQSSDSGLATLAFVFTCIPEMICLTATSILLVLK